jgi:hypothetical protein
MTDVKTGNCHKINGDVSVVMLIHMIDYFSRKSHPIDLKLIANNLSIYDIFTRVTCTTYQKGMLM